MYERSTPSGMNRVSERKDLTYLFTPTGIMFGRDYVRHLLHAESSQTLQHILLVCFLMKETTQVQKHAVSKCMQYTSYTQDGDKYLLFQENLVCSASPVLG